MLAREKKRATWSIIIGLIGAATVAVWAEWQAHSDDQRAHVLIAKCEATAAHGTRLPKGAVEICDPSNLTLDRPDEFVGSLKVIADIQNDATGWRNNIPIWSLGLFAIFCIPLFWYLILDRIREVSAAVSGRDQNLP
jgi:hypothetical protein